MLILRQGPYSERKEALSLGYAGQSFTKAATTERPARHRPPQHGAFLRPRKPFKERSVSIRHKVGTIAGTMAVSAAVSLTFLPGTASAHTLSFNQKAAAYAKSFVGRVPYRYGGGSPGTGFDCSGLTSYVYRHYGKSIPRTADAQFHRFRR